MLAERALARFFSLCFLERFSIIPEDHATHPFSSNLVLIFTLQCKLPVLIIRDSHLNGAVMPILLPLAAVFIWSVNTIVNKMSVSVIAPGAMAFYRWFFAILVLTPFCLPTLWRQRRAVLLYVPRLALLALLGMVTNQSVAYFAAQTTTATNMALIMSLVPMLSLFMSIQLLSQPLTARAIIGPAYPSFGSFIC